MRYPTVRVYERVVSETPCVRLLGRFLLNFSGSFFLILCTRIKAQVENEKLHWDKGRNRLSAIKKDLDLSDTEPLYEAPLVNPANPDFSYLQGPEVAHMARFPALRVDDTLPKEEPKGKKTILEKRKSSSSASSQYKTDKKLYAYELATPGERTEVTTVDYRDFQECNLAGEVLALQTYKSKDVILLYGSDSVPNRRAEAMFPGLNPFLSFFFFHNIFFQELT